MSVFAIGPHRIAEAAGYRPGRSHEVAKDFLGGLLWDPTSEKLDQLLKTYPDFDLAVGQDRNWTALAVAIYRKSLPLIHRILELRPDLLNKSCYGSAAGPTPLGIAVRNDDPAFSLRAVNALLARGADVNLADLEGITPLFSSALRPDHIAVTRALLDRGGVIYEAARRVLSGYGWVDRSAIAGQPANIAAALEGVSRFARGQLYDHPAHPMNRLPLDLCKEVASFVVPTSYLDEQTP